MTVTDADLAAATARLRRQPADHGAWLEVATLLASLGEEADAEVAFAALGEGARVGGQVALALACARHLAQTGSLRGPELIERVVEQYAGRGAAVAVPPDAPAAVEDAPAVALGATPREDARAVIAALGPWLAAQVPDAVAPAPLLSALPAPAARALAGVMSARAVTAGSLVIEAGATASSLFWLAHGALAVARADGTVLGELHAGALFGEIALVGGTRRTANVTAVRDAWILEIPARAVETAAQRHPGLAEVLARHARARLLANLVRTSELFHALDDTDRDELLARFETCLVQAGTAFLREGAANDHLWVVVSGRCEVRAAGAPLVELGAGAAVGELSLLRGAPAIADVVAVEPAVLLRLARADFAAIAGKYPALLAEIEKLVAARETANRALFHDASDLIV